MKPNFEVTIKVTGCNDCPFCTEDVWCSKGNYETPEEYEKVFKENRTTLTKSCPVYKKQSLTRFVLKGTIIGIY